MPARLTKIDDLTRPDHYYLSSADECYCLGEYTARAGFAYSPMIRYAEASSWAEAAAREQPNHLSAAMVAAASGALAGRLSEAEKAMARVRQLHPALRISNLKDHVSPVRRSEDFARWAEALRKAGLPE